jgi:hypothetical protein
MRLSWAGLCVALVLAVSGRAGAHSVGADCYASSDGKTLVVEAWMGDGSAPREAKVTVRRPDGSVLAAGTLDAKGRFRFMPEKAAAYEVMVDCGLGHVRRFTVRQEELARLSLPGGARTGAAPGVSAPAVGREGRADRALRVVVGLTLIAAVVAALCAAASLRAVRRLERALRAREEGGDAAPSD